MASPLGIGGATARRLAAEGASVLIADIDDDAAAANVERIADGGGTAVASHIDVSSSDDCRRMVDDTIDAFGRLDILVQNAFSVISGESRIHGGRAERRRRGTGTTASTCWSKRCT